MASSNLWPDPAAPAPLTTPSRRLHACSTTRRITGGGSEPTDLDREVEFIFKTNIESHRFYRSCPPGSRDGRSHDHGNDVGNYHGNDGGHENVPHDVLRSPNVQGNYKNDDSNGDMENVFPREDVRNLFVFGPKESGNLITSKPSTRETRRKRRSRGMTVRPVKDALMVKDGHWDADADSFDGSLGGASAHSETLSTCSSSCSPALSSFHSAPSPR